MLGNKIKLKKSRITASLLYIIILTLLLGCNQSSQDWAFNFVVWNGDIYEIDESVTVDAENEIDTVEKYVEQEGNYTGVFSNFLPKGSKIYKIKEKNTDEVIAVEVNGIYVEARNQGKYGE